MDFTQLMDRNSNLKKIFMKGGYGKPQKKFFF